MNDQCSAVSYLTNHRCDIGRGHAGEHRSGTLCWAVDDFEPEPAFCGWCTDSVGFRKDSCIGGGIDENDSACCPCVCHYR